jgi:hypothetical protein
MTRTMTIPVGNRSAAALAAAQLLKSARAAGVEVTAHSEAEMRGKQ